jgi:protein-S-isoprenylcysteine O-methyltransferase Ste14
MSPLSRLRHRSPWVAGALLLAFLGLPLVAAALRFGLDSWPYLLGAGAVLLLLAGWLERWWQSRPVGRPPSRSRAKERSRFRVLEGGRAAEARPSDLDAEDETDEEPKWLM